MGWRTWMILAVSLVPSTVQAKLELSNIQAAYGPLWPERRTLDYYPPDDLIFFRFSVTGLKTREENHLDLEITATLADSRGKVVLAHTMPGGGPFTLIGGAQTLWAVLPIQSALSPGEYTFNVTLTDNIANKRVTFERKVRLRPPEFAVRAVEFFFDSEMRIPAPCRVQVGQTLYHRIKVSGENPHMEVHQKLEIIDYETKVAVPKPWEATIKGDEVMLGLGAAFQGNTGMLTRAGRFILRCTLTDSIAKKTLTFEVPLHVMSP